MLLDDEPPGHLGQVKNSAVVRGSVIAVVFVCAEVSTTREIVFVILCCG
jgi:hypothetical protein